MNKSRQVQFLYAVLGYFAYVDLTDGDEVRDGSTRDTRSGGLKQTQETEDKWQERQQTRQRLTR